MSIWQIYFIIYLVRPTFAHVKFPFGNILFSQFIDFMITIILSYSCLLSSEQREGRILLGIIYKGNPGGRRSKGRYT
jgi:hypothetical protein